MAAVSPLERQCEFGSYYPAGSSVKPPPRKAAGTLAAILADSAVRRNRNSLQQKTNKKMTKYSLADIKKKVNELALKINAPKNLLPTYNQIIGDATPCIEVDNNGYMYYVISERGEEYERKRTDKIDDLLYWIFASVTFSMSCKYELNNRIENKDCRRIMFAKQEELLGQLNETWREMERTKHQHILNSSTFDDLAGLRATFWGQLRKIGYSEIECKKLAYAKYPRD